MKLTTTQAAQLDVLRRAHDTHKDIRRNSEARVRMLVAQEVAASQHELDRHIRLTVQTGVPKKQIVEALHVSPNAVYDSLRRTEDIAELVTTDEPKDVRKFEWADDTRESVRVSLAGAWWDTLKSEFADKIRKNPDADSAVYPILDDGTMSHRTDWTDRTTPNKYDNPVSAWLSYYGGADEAAEWLEGQE